MKNQKGISIFLIVVLLLICSATGIFAYLAYVVYSSGLKPQRALATVKLKADVLAFAHQQVPDLYNRLIALDNLVVLVDDELGQLKRIKRSYPSQNNIVGNANASLTEKRRILAEALQTAGQKVEALYVSYLINPTRGARDIQRQKSSLIKEINSAIMAEKELALRLEAKRETTLVDRLKNLLRLVPPIIPPQPVAVHKQAAGDHHGKSIKQSR
jgi:hypothetical protein